MKKKRLSRANPKTPRHGTLRENRKAINPDWKNASHGIHWPWETPTPEVDTRYWSSLQQRIPPGLNFGPPPTAPKKA